MAFNTYYFTGEVRWAKVHRPDEKYGKFSLDIKLSEKDQELFQSLGLKNGIKEGWVSLRRDPMKKVWQGGEQLPLGNLPVVDEHGNTFKDNIGNGSVCTVKFVVNEFKSKNWGQVKSTWLDAVRVDKLVKYESGNPSNSGASAPTTGNQPRVLF